MSDHQEDAVLDLVEKVGRAVHSVRIVVGGLIAVMAAVACGFVWVNSTTTALVQIEHRLDQFDAATTVREKEWAAWRTANDQAVARIVTLEEQQMRLYERLADRVDRMTAK